MLLLVAVTFLSACLVQERGHANHRSYGRGHGYHRH